MKPTKFAFDRSWDFDLPRDALWAHLSDTPSFTRWWPWLRAFDPVPVEIGATTWCVIGPPLPYVLRVQLTVTSVVPKESVDVGVTGDLRGPARLELDDRGDGSQARLVWTVEVRRPMLRAAARMGRPILQWGHDWVVTNGVQQFRKAIS